MTDDLTEHLTGHLTGRPGGGLTRAQAERLLETGLSRAGFLRLTGAAGLGAVGGPALLGGTASAAVLAPQDLQFRLRDRTRPFDLIAPRFVEVDLQFGGTAAGAAPAAAAPEDRAAAGLAVSGGLLQVEAAAPDGALFRLGGTPLAPYATVVVDVAVTPPAGTSVLVGLAGGGGDRVVARFTPGTSSTAGTVTITVTRRGRTTRVAQERADLSGPARFAFSLQENYVTALVGRTASWTPVAQARLLGDPAVPSSGLDLRDPAVLRTFSYAYGAAGNGGQVQVSRIQAGLFGQVGVRDPHVVTLPDGTPYVRDGWLYLTMTNAGLSFFQAAHWAVWRLRLDDPTRLEHTAQLFFARDGLLLGDHAGHLVVDEQRGVTHVAVSGWGDFAFEGVRSRYARVTSDLLRGAHVIASRQMPLPTGVSSWDPGMTRIGDRWYVSFVESPYQRPTFRFHPALARGPVGAVEPVTGLTLVGADRSRTMTEGPLLVRVGGRYWLLASDGEQRRYLVYDLQVRLQGLLQAPYGTNIPHPMLVKVPGTRRWLMLTFDGTQYVEPVLGYGTHGDFLVLEAREP